MNAVIPLFKVFMNEQIDLSDVLKSGNITQGKKVELFEKELQTWFNYPYILTINSATSGLTLAIRLLNLPAGSEILSTPLTCTATNFPILANNHKIKWVDIDPSTCNIDLDDLERKITSKTKAILFVHWGGYPVDLDRLKSIQDKAELIHGYRIPIIEDCAHAFGAKYKNKFIGTSSENICVFSLQAIKHLTTGDGGLIFLPNNILYERVKLLRWYGISREQRNSGCKDLRMEADIIEWGYKFHMNDINASIGLYNLPSIHGNLVKIRDNALYYRNKLKNLLSVQLLKELDYSESAYWIFTIRVTNKSNFIEYMSDNYVVVSQVHNRNDIHSCLKEFVTELPQLDKLEKEIVSIPVGWWLSIKDRKRIVDLIVRWDVINNLQRSPDGYAVSAPIVSNFLLDAVVRDLTIDDYDKGYLELLKQMNNYDYKKYLTRERWTKLFSKILSTSSIVIIERYNKVIATGKVLYEYKFGNPQAHIEDIVVDEEYRRGGLASIILKYLTKLAIDKNCYKISLCANNELTDLYTKNSFVDAGKHFVIYNNIL
jgi:dTDP-4-amino-4,6-dideoxygalactose transaminase/GNAT superfamily N-acetyltransferase